MIQYTIYITCRSSRYIVTYIVFVIELYIKFQENLSITCSSQMMKFWILLKIYYDRLKLIYCIWYNYLNITCRLTPACAYFKMNSIKIQTFLSIYNWRSVGGKLVWDVDRSCIAGFCFISLMLMRWKFKQHFTSWFDKSMSCATGNTMTPNRKLSTWSYS